MSMLRLLEEWLSRGDREAGRFALWLGLVFLFSLILLFLPWSGNEEHYFQLAFKRMAPESFPEFHAVFDKSAGRLLPETIVGSFVSVFGYEAAHGILRMVQVVLYAGAFAMLFRALEFSLLDAFAAIAIFLFAGEQFFGGEWLFQGVEAKTLAYGFVIIALSLGIQKKLTAATLVMVVATWLHFLIGGFWMVALIVLQFLDTKSWKSSAQMVGLYSLLVLPLVIMIGIQQFGSGLPATSPSPAEIYAERSRHHIAPFLGSPSEWLIWGWWKGLSLAFFMLIACAIYIRHARNQRLVAFVSVLLLYLLLAQVISLLDRNTLLFSNLYLFRPSSLTLMLLICVFLFELRGAMAERAALLRRLALFVLVALFVTAQAKNDAELMFRSPGEPFAPLMAAVEKHSAADEVVLTPPSDGGFGDLDQFLVRKLNRPTLVSYKFVPVYPPDLVKWHELITKRKQLYSGECTALAGYPVRVLIVTDEKALQALSKCGEVVWRGKGGYLVRLPG